MYCCSFQESESSPSTKLYLCILEVINPCCVKTGAELSKEVKEKMILPSNEQICWGMCLLMDFPCGSVVKNLPANAGEVGLIPGWGRFSGEGNGNPL